MSKIADIKAEINEAKKLLEEQRVVADAARAKWYEESQKQMDINFRIDDLRVELREAKQECFDEDGMYIGEQI